MAVYDMKELNELAREPAMCPMCVAGPSYKGWDRKLKPKFARIYVDKVVGSDCNGDIRMTTIQRILPCKKHGPVVYEQEL